ncbi:MAG: PD-(D/E)XK nuclease family protein, partial [Zoogloea sp.]|nr:PD-(D/E)XK nuclease family protein [Zoogloea sp.]
VIGADAEHLAPDDRRPVFAHDGVRAELGLPDRAAARARLGEDMAGLIALSGEVCITWQYLQGSEAVLPCAEVDVLSLLHEAAFGDDLKVPLPPVPVPMHPHVGQAMPAPVLPAGRVPQRVSASGLKSLIECPYQYFGRYVLGLGEFGEVTEALEKSDYGEMIHAVLQRFHTRFPLVTGVEQAVLLAALAEETDAIFGPALARNFLEHAWLGRWRVRLPAYLDWQREREAAGWRFAGAEGRKELMLSLANGSPLMLYGRLDRIDTSVDGSRVAVLDYKTRGVKPLRDQAASPDDVQLAVYTLLRGEAVTEAAYVALDDEVVAAIPLAEPQAVAAAQRERLVAVFSALQAGAALPAHGTGACQWCEMRGLCRKDHHS